MSIAPPKPKYVGPPKHHGGPGNKPIKRIVVHATVGAEPHHHDAAENTVAYSKKTPRPSSFHYVADAYKSLQYTYDKTIAYHAPPNTHSLGYELCCSLSNEGKGHWGTDSHKRMMARAAEDIARLCLHYGVPIRKINPVQLKAGMKGICGHADVSKAWRQSSHWDPGPYFPWPWFIKLVKAKAAHLKEPTPSRGANVDAAIADLVAAAKKNQRNPARLARIKASLAALRAIKPK